jgi:hypothetical protein
MNTTEELLRLDESNFDEHIAELKELFGIDPKQSGDLSIHWTSSGGIGYRTSPRETLRADKTFERYVVEEPVGKFKTHTKPRFFLRTHYDKGLVLLIECISEYQTEKWRDAVAANEKYFTREDRYRSNGSDTVFWEANDNAYIKYSIKRKRLNTSQTEELRKILEQFMATVWVPPGTHGTNTHDVGRLWEELRTLTKKKVVRKKKEELVTA